MAGTHVRSAWCSLHDPCSVKNLSIPYDDRGVPVIFDCIGVERKMRGSGEADQFKRGTIRT
jgi:hypothetical protein